MFIVTISGAALFACSDASSPDSPLGTDAGGSPEAAATDANGGVDSSTNDVDADADSGLGALIHTLSPLPAVPADPTNAVADNALAAALGQMLFFDKSFSGALAVGDDGLNGGLGAFGDLGKVSCASCHSGTVLDDRRSKPGNVSLGTDFGTRRALALVNASFYTWTNWGGRFDSQWSLPLAVAENPVIMKGTRLAIIHSIYAKYKTEYEAIFGALDPRLDPANANAANFPPGGKPKAAGALDGPWEGMTGPDRTIANTIYANFGKAIAAYMRKLVSREAPFDKYVAGDKSAISASAENGLKLFLGKGACVGCHSGPHFEDGQFHALGVPQSGPHVPATDLGRFTDVAPLLASPFNTNGAFSANVNTGKLTGLAQVPAQTGQFRTKGLRGVGVTGPYMHSGQLSSLGDVVAFYNLGGGADLGDGGATKDALIKPLGLTPTENADLVEFMKTLTGEAVPAALSVDTSK
ncbi:MAG: cytochrome c peroxidase [Myxococcales bacterium]|jgi:cytochrome c peroxidase|nr:cytochrome c peroxidase [Myxococcales bacterium]